MITERTKRVAINMGNRSAEKHGHSNGGVNGGPTPTYISWRRMIDRCHSPKHPAFNRYGGCGISVCKAWRDDFRSFLNDMGERPAGLTLDRIDNRFGYFYSNCRWATWHEQAANRVTRNQYSAALGK